MDVSKQMKMRSGMAVAIAVLMATMNAISGVAEAATPELLARIGAESSAAAGKLGNPAGVATDPATGHLFVADRSNQRVSEFTVWSAFVKAWGWGVADGVSPSLQTCTTVCFQGIQGSGAGQFASPQGLAVGPGGAVYVFEREDFRTQKFNAAGEFLLMFGGEVNKTKTAEGKPQAERNVCTASSGDTCGIGVAGTGEGEFGIENVNGVAESYIGVGPEGTVYVGDKGRIQKFDATGAFKGEIQLPEDRNPGALAVDPVSGNIYFAFNQGVLQTAKVPGVLEFTPAGAFVRKLEVEAPEAIAVDPIGHVYVVNDPPAFGIPGSEPVVWEFDSSGQRLIGPGEAFAMPEVEHGELTGLATNTAGDVYVVIHLDPVAAYVDIYGPPPVAIEPPPAVAPTILDQFAVSVGTTSASVRASVNPHYWADTRYFVEYGTSSCAVGGCGTQPSPPGLLLSTRVVNAPLTGPAVSLFDLKPGTTYHYRFVARSGGGGPTVGQERTFTTSSPQPSQPQCLANQAFRLGPAARLPDCRAYEMVSPVDKQGADIEVVFTDLGDRAGLDQGDPSGEKIAYSAYRAFGNPESAPYTSQYIASRDRDTGWSSESISPPRRGPSLYNTKGLDSQYKAFSSNLCSGWLLQDSDLSLAPGSVAGFPNLYRRENCTGGYEALTTVAPPNVEPQDLLLEPEGTSADGSRAIFRADDVLATGGAKGKEQLYEAHEGNLTLVCVRPNKTASKESCSTGTPGATSNGRNGSVSHAISDDGSVIYWSEANNGPGKIFVRIEGKETAAVSAGLTAQFWTAAADGSKAIYSEGGKLFEFSLATKASTLIAGGFQGLVGASEDASRIYLVSSNVLATGGAAGKPNLYLREAGGGVRFVATLDGGDLSDRVYSPVSLVPLHHSSQVSPDGGAVAFMSIARPGPTGFDNTDANSGEADAEVYLYNADANNGAGRLRCVSCLVSGARPSGRSIQDEANLSNPFWAAAQIPTAENQLYAPRVLSDDGSRLFFESFDALVSGDTNGRQDVYEWEVAGSGNCAEGGPGFLKDLGGCVNLISSGESPQGSEIVDSSSDGRDVFFKTASSLAAQDPDLIDIYDARAGGGFAPPPSPPLECEGEACQHPAPPPSDPTPSSVNVIGPENPKPLKCPRRKHKVTRHGRASCKQRKHRRAAR